jgi:hypothetical protein
MTARRRAGTAHRCCGPLQLPFAYARVRAEQGRVGQMRTKSPIPVVDGKTCFERRSIAPPGGAIGSLRHQEARSFLTHPQTLFGTFDKH